MKDGRLPKPFEPLCDYEESESEEENENSTKSINCNAPESDSKSTPNGGLSDTSTKESSTSENAESTISSFSNAQKTSAKRDEKSLGLSNSSSFAVPNSKSEINSKLRQLEMMKNAARKLNHEAVVNEDKDSKLPANWQVLQKKNEWMLYEEEQKKVRKWSFLGVSILRI